ncbi:MAG: type III-A CRISPR-associated RAMP protein Csm3 [Pseudomonadota bacterium]|nr:type III-A CRISPR-associated RAMP protein Csm3 [Pseudomonadota bacterium]
MTPIRLLHIHRINAVLELRSGLHIGADRDAVEIGGLDNPVVRHPHTRDPYIPGSSLKGRLRTLLEWALHRVEADGGVWGADPGGFTAGKYTQADPILRIFGTAHPDWRGGPTRLAVRDAFCTPDWRAAALDNALPLTEEKAELAIDRIQGRAADTGPRRFERIVAGARFDLELMFKIFETGNDAGATDRACLNRLLEGLKLLERDALGGGGSRGGGRVRIVDLAVDGVSVQERFDAIATLSPEAPADLLGSVGHG